MTIKDKLAHYEPKPLGEKGRYAVLLPLIYDVKTDKYQILYQVRSEHISQPGEVSFPGGRVEEGETFHEEVKRLFTIYVDTLLTENPIYYKVISTLSDAKDFPFFLVKNREKYNFGYSERHIPFYRNLTENIWGMTAMFTHRFTDILKDLE